MDRGDAPENIQSYIAIVVSHDMTLLNNLLPRDFWMVILSSSRDFASSLTDDLREPFD